jgi:exopolysaccharide production protein ExoZ
VPESLHPPSETRPSEAKPWEARVAADQPERPVSVQAGTQEIAPVQVLRAISAIAVSILHVAQAAGAFVGTPGEAPYPWLKFLPWDASVDIFFVISGFVMVYASTRLFARPGGVRLFVGRRLARIVPLYWIATTLVLLVAFARPGALSEPLGGGIGYIVASYLFIPWLRPDGFIQPVFRLGWTLNYELLFYTLFALFLPLPRRYAAACVSAALVALAASGMLFRPAMPQLVFWTDPIVVEFAAGMLVATMLLAGTRLGMSARAAMALCGVAMLYFEGRSDGPWRLVTYGVPATLFLAAGVLGRPGGRITTAMRLGVLLGDASYAIYLVHPFPMRALREVWARLHWTGMAGILSYILCTLLLSCAAAVVLHLWLEMPLTRATRRLLRV